MAYQDNKGAYKNPAIPKPRQQGSAPPAGTATPVAPGRKGGLMQRAALAKFRQTKPGQPPIPGGQGATPPTGPIATSTQQQKYAPIVDPDQRRDDLERERLRLKQQKEQSRIAYERRQTAIEQRKRAEAMQQQPPLKQDYELMGAKPEQEYRKLAAQKIAEQGTEEDKYPTLKKPEELEDEIQQLGVQQADTGEGGAEAVAGPEAQGPTALGEGEDQSQGQKFDQPEPPAPTGDDAVEPSPPPVEEGAETADKEKSLEEWQQEAKGKVWKDKDGNEQYKVEGGKVYEKKPNGEWGDAGGSVEGWEQIFKHAGFTSETADTGTPSQSSWGEGLVYQTMNKMSSWLNQATGIPEQELKGQIAQIHMQSADQIAKFANLMAARGVGAGGLMGVGMGQIASQTVAAIANLRFENEKMKIEERLNKMKTMAAAAGQFMSEQNRMNIFEQMNELEQKKFDYAQEQDRVANSWTDLNDMTALLQAKNGWDAKTLAWAKKLIDEGEDPYNIYNKLFVNADGKVAYSGDYNPTGEGSFKLTPPSLA